MAAGGVRCTAQNSKAGVSSQSGADVLNPEQFKALEEWQKNGGKVAKVKEFESELNKLNLKDFTKEGNQFKTQNSSILPAMWRTPNNYILASFQGKLFLFLQKQNGEYEVITAVETRPLVDSLNYRGIYVKDLNVESKEPTNAPGPASATQTPPEKPTLAEVESVETQIARRYELDTEKELALQKWNAQEGDNITTASAFKTKVEELVKKDFQARDYGFVCNKDELTRYLLFPHSNKLILFSVEGRLIDQKDGGQEVESIYTVLATADIREFLQLKGIKDQEKYKGIPIKALQDYYDYYSAMQKMADK